MCVSCCIVCHQYFYVYVLLYCMPWVSLYVLLYLMPWASLCVYPAVSYALGIYRCISCCILCPGCINVYVMLYRMPCVSLYLYILLYVIPWVSGYVQLYVIPWVSLFVCPAVGYSLGISVCVCTVCGILYLGYLCMCM